MGKYGSYEDTGEFMAAKFPFLRRELAEDIDAVLGVVRTQCRGRSHISFDAVGIDSRGHVIVKSVDATIRRIRLKPIEQRSA